MAAAFDRRAATTNGIGVNVGTACGYPLEDSTLQGMKQKLRHRANASGILSSDSMKQI
jgi:hypothetical protein